MKFYTVDDLVVMFDVHPETIRRMLKSGELKGFKMGKGWRITEEEVERYIESLKEENKVDE